MSLTSPVPFRVTADGISFSLHVQPRASRTGMCGIQGDAIKIRLTSSPVDGSANRQCLEYLASLLGVSKRAISIISGETSRHKTIKVEGITPERFLSALSSGLDSGRP